MPNYLKKPTSGEFFRGPMMNFRCCGFALRNVVFWTLLICICHAVFKNGSKKNEGQIEIKFNHDFKKVISLCAEKKRPGQKGTWITAGIKRSYLELFKAGGAYSLECYRGDELIGGIYGVKSPKYYSCESMFFNEPNASKLALYKLIQRLQLEGHTWLDIQMVTDVSGQFGGKYISKKKFLKRIGL